jgi:hypothetical protein
MTLKPIRKADKDPEKSHELFPSTAFRALQICVGGKASPISIRDNA